MYKEFKLLKFVNDIDKFSFSLRTQKRGSAAIGEEHNTLYA